MIDPFLIAHEVSPPGIYSVAGKLSPASIRDQMIRATAIVDRALEAEVIGPTRSLLVVGAGAGGVSAAVRAAENQVPTSLVERRPQPFYVQRDSQTRWIDPTLYDWPAEHWGESQIPLRRNTFQIPLPWSSGSASQVAGDWDARFREALDSFSDNLGWYPNTELTALEHLKTGSPLALAAAFRTRIAKSLLPPDRFAMALVCTGAGIENLDVGSYRGLSYWGREDEELETYIQRPPGTTTWLVSGGGDGALQDFLRIATRGRNPQEIYSGLTGSARRDIEHQVYSLEDRAQRALVWGSERLDHYVLAQLHNDYGELVTWVFSVAGDTTRRLLGRLIDSNCRVTLAFKCTHFGRCLPFNRFLVLLICRYLQEQPNGTILKAGVELARVTPAAPHVCSERHPEDCMGQEHDVVLRAAACKEGDAGPDVTARYSAIVVRHGVRTEPASFPVSVRLPRQVMPYDYQWPQPSDGT